MDGEREKELKLKMKELDRTMSDFESKVRLLA